MRKVLLQHFLKLQTSNVRNQCRQAGFTLIEMIVSLALFSIVVVVSVGALLMLVGTNNQLQGEQSVMTNLSFALDSMTRELRTGTAYYCFSMNSPLSGGGAVNLDALIGDAKNDCQNGNPSNLRYHGIIFKEAGDSITGNAERIAYYFDRQEGRIYRIVSSAAPESIVSSGIFIREAEFVVTGTRTVEEGGLNRDIQPTITVFIEAAEGTEVDAKPYYIQTTITQRSLDV